MMGGLAVVAVGAFAMSGGPKEEVTEMAVVRRGTLVQEVSTTGKVQSAGRVELGFERTGRVATINGEVGAKVSAGSIIAALDNRDLVAQVNEQRASVALAQAQVAQYAAALEAEEIRLREIKKGVRPEEITLAQTRVDNAKRSVENAQENLDKVTAKNTTDVKNVYDDVPDVLANAYANVSQAINADTTLVFTRQNTSIYELTFQSCDQAAQTLATQERYELELVLPQWQAQIQAVNNGSSVESLDGALATARTNTARAKRFFDAINSLITQRCSGREPPAATFQTANNAGIALVNAAVTSLSTQSQAIDAQKKTQDSAVQTAENALSEAQNVLESAQSELALKKAKATDEQVQIQEAKVKQSRAVLASQQAQIAQAQARVQSAQAQFEKTIIRSPVTGIITKLDVKVGETASPSIAVIGVVSAARFEIESNIAEVDVAKLQPGMKARVTLDAYGNDVTFDAAVTKIDPAETLISGVPTYKATFQFSQDDERIRLGMTANVDIETAKLENVLIIPQRAVIHSDEKKTVQVIINKGKKDERIEEKTMVTGLRGSDGMVEVKEGLSEGEDIVLSL